MIASRLSRGAVVVVELDPTVGHEQRGVRPCIIVSDPEVLRGKPRIKGTRIPVGLVLGYLAAGKTSKDILAEFPDLTGEQIAACLDYARELAEFEAVV